MKRNFITVSQILEYVFTFLYYFVAALFFSVGESIYWLFIALGLVSICVGLYTAAVKEKLLYPSCKKDKIIGIVLTVLSVVAFPACVFLLISLLSKAEVKDVQPKIEEVKPKEKKKWYKAGSFITTCIAIAVIIVSSLTGMLFETSGGKVTVKDFTLTKAETDLYNRGQPLNGTSYTIDDPTVSISYTMYKPNEASATNQLPVVFVVPGFTRTKATMSQYAIELSRRGAVVFTIDPGSQGATTYGGYQYDVDNEEYVLDNNGNKIQNSYSVARSGMGYLLQYVYNNIEEFDYIDRDAIGLMGHSAGGGDATKLAADFAGTSFDTSIVKALYISGYIKTSAASVYSQLRANVAMSYAKYDEGAFRYQDENQAYEVIALRFINEVNSKTNGANGTFTEYEEDKAYGDMATGTYRILHREKTNHCFEMYDGLSITNTTSFFRESLGLETEVEDSSQVWFGKELSNGIALAAAFTLIASLLCFVTTYVPFMASLSEAGEKRLEAEKQIRKDYCASAVESDVSTADKEKDKKEEEEKVPLGEKPTGARNRSFGKRLIFWLPMILTAIIACLDYIPLARWSMDLFPDAAGNVYTTFFPARMMNAVFMWAVVNGAVGLVIWTLTTLCENAYYTIYAKITGTENRSDWSKFKGLAVKPLDLLKSLGLAIVLFGVFYGLLQLTYITTHQDWRFMLISASPLNKRFLFTWLIYLGGFFVFYLSNSIRVNLSIAREGFKEWQVMLIGGLANSLGLMFIIVINYFVFFKTGTVFYGYYAPTDTSEMWLYVNMVFGLIPMMFLLPILNRIAYKKLGNVYSGALLWCMIFIMMSLSASISFIPM